MEDLIGFLVFAAIAGFSIFSKYREQKKAEEVAKERRLRKRPEDLPERTRKMLYGESGVPPKRGGEPTYRTARERTAPSPTPQRQAAPPVRRQERRPIEERHTVLSNEEFEVREKRAQAQRTLEEMWRQAKAAEERARRKQQKAQRRQQQREATPPPPPPKPKPQPARRPEPARATRGQRQRQLAAMFGSRGALRAGIIMSEVLSPPVSFREQQRGGMS